MSDPSYERRLQWFHEARFGMFIHFGLYALLERGEWVMFNERIAPGEYAKLADRFNPEHFDANQWVELARRAGMRYLVFTTRHHDGFCLYDSKVSTFTSTGTRAQRDFVAEIAGACRKAGLRVGLYYSLMDWRFPGYFEPEKHPGSATALVEQAHAQVRELLSNYGKIDVLWYDGGWISHGRLKEKYPDFWRAKELNAMARQLQPDILINNRSGTTEDLDTPEQHVTASAPGRGWESCMPIGDSAGWGYVRHSPNMKTVPTLLQNLITAAAGEGNYLLNVGPQPDGRIRKEEVERLEAIGDWMAVHGEAIYGSQRCELPDQRLPGAPIGMWTRKGSTAYLHVFRWTSAELVVPLVSDNVVSAQLLTTRSPLHFRREYNHRLVIEGLPADPPHPDVNVIKVDFDGVPHVIVETDKSAWLRGEA